MYFSTIYSRTWRFTVCRQMAGIVIFTLTTRLDKIKASASQVLLANNRVGLLVQYLLPGRNVLYVIIALLLS